MMVTIQGSQLTTDEVWAQFAGDQSASAFLAGAESAADQCRAYAVWASTAMADTSDEVPAWTDDDTDALAYALLAAIEAAYAWRERIPTIELLDVTTGEVVTAPVVATDDDPSAVSLMEICERAGSWVADRNAVR